MSYNRVDIENKLDLMLAEIEDNRRDRYTKTMYHGTRFGFDSVRDNVPRWIDIAKGKRTNITRLLLWKHINDVNNIIWKKRLRKYMVLLDILYDRGDLTD